MTKTKFKQTEIGIIPEDWEIELAKKFCERITDGTHDSPKKNKSGKYLITSKYLKNNSINFENAYFISEVDFNEINKRSKVNQWDIILSMIGTVGEVYIEKNKIINYAIKNVGLFKFNGDKNKAFWFYYYTKSKYGQEYIKTRKTGSTQQYLTLEALRRFPIVYPSSNQERNQIIKILSDLDSKIELNQQMNKTLEEIGQAIFKRWFIDFEFPNEEGKPYKSSGGEMVDSELGKIPKGWKVEKYEDLVDVSTGKGLKREDFIEGGKYPVLGANGELGRTDNFLFEEKLILTGRVGTLGTIHLIRDKAWISDNVLISKPKLEENYYYAYLTIKKFDFKSLNRGSTQPLITQTDLKNQRILIPNNKILLLFHKICLSLFDKIYQNEYEKVRLSQIRDSLLPKLMSGKIRVPVEVRR